jgi:hypothetical protein
MLIQIILLIVVAALLALFVRNWQTVGVRAMKRLAFLAFVVIVVIAVLRPDWVSSVAHTLGVGRGTDLVLYLLAAAFVFVSVNTYFRFKTQENKFTELVRSIAIREAVDRNRERLGPSGRPGGAAGAACPGRTGRGDRAGRRIGASSRREG